MVATKKLRKLLLRGKILGRAKTTMIGWGQVSIFGMQTHFEDWSSLKNFDV